MDTNELLDVDMNIDDRDNEMTAHAQAELLHANVWARSLGVFWYIVMGFVSLCAVFALFSSFSEGIHMLPTVLLFVGICILCYYLARAIYNFGKYISWAVKYQSSPSTNVGFKNLRFYMQIMGILSLVYAAIYIWFLIFVIL